MDWDKEDERNLTEGLPGFGGDYVTPSVAPSAPVIGTPPPEPANGVSVPPAPQFAPAGPEFQAPDSVAIPATISQPGAPVAPTPAVAPRSVPPISSGNPMVDNQVNAERSDNEAVVAAKIKELEADKSKTQAQAEGQDAIARQARDNQVELQAELQDQKDRQAEAQRIADKAADEYRNFKMHDFYRDASTGTKIMRALAVGFGSFAQNTYGGRGGPNQALQIIQGAADADFRQQQAQLATKENFSRMKAEGVKDLAAQYRTDVANLALKHAAALNAVGDEVKAKLIKDGMTADEADGNTMVAGLRAAASKKSADRAMQIANDEAQRKMAEAHLGIAYGTLALSRENTTLNHQERQERAADAKEAKAAKAAEAEDARKVTLVDGSSLVLPTARAAPEFVKGYNSRIQASQKMQALIDDLKKNGSVYGPDAVADREGKLADAVGAVASITPLGQSDHSTHIEAKTLGPNAIRTLPWNAGPDIALKLAIEKKKQIDEGTERIIRTYRHGGGDPTPGTASGVASAPAPKPSPTTLAPAYIARAQEVLAHPEKYSAGDVARAKQIAGGGQ